MSKDLVLRALKLIGGTGTLIDIQEAMLKLDPEGKAWLYAAHSLRACVKSDDVKLASCEKSPFRTGPRRRVWFLTSQGREAAEQADREAIARLPSPKTAS